MKKKTLLISLALLLATSLLTIGCPPPEEIAEPPVEPLLIAGPLSLTGPLAKLALMVELAYKDWAEHVNARGGLLGRPVELRIYDSEFKIARGVELYKKAITIDGADFMLPTYQGHVSRAVMAIADEYGMLYTGMGGHMASFEEGFTYVAVPVPLMGEWWAAGLGDLLLAIPEEERPRKAFIMSAKLAITEACGVSLRYELNRAGIPFVERSYTLPLATADPLILEAKKLGADLLILNGLFPDSVLAMESAAKFGFEPKLIWQSVGMADREWVEILGDQGNQVISGSVWFPGLPFPNNDLIAEMWAERHAEKHGDFVALYYGFGWNWILSLQLGIEGAQSFDQTEVRDWLHNNELHLPAGIITLEERGLPTEPTNYIIQWQDGVLQNVWPLGPTQTADLIFPRR